MTAKDCQRAQEYAVAWATQADAEYCEAIRLEDGARARDNDAPGYVLQARERARRAAQFHGTRSVEAARMAEMWARVASALQHTHPGAIPPPPEHPPQPPTTPA